jgi:GTP-binding protein
MIPMVAIVGRPNVGKSTLFNRLTKTRRALVDDLPGVTRDRLYGLVERDEISFTLVDTGGFDPPEDMEFAKAVHAQIELALEEADLILFLTDHKAGISPLDYEVADKLRRTQKPVITAVNKVDGAEKEDLAGEFYGLGMDPLMFISSAHGYGVRDLIDEIADRLAGFDAQEDDPDDDNLPVRVALAGRPNVGKSSLVNALVGSNRVVVSEVAGTTRDAVDTPFSFGSRDYVLIDTAGIRRQGKVRNKLEKAGVFRSLRAVERCHVAVCVIDCVEGVTDSDLRIIGQAVATNRGLVVALNKWDLLEGQTEKQRKIKEDLAYGLKFAPFAPVLNLSALTGWGLKKLLPAVDKVYRDYNRRMGTGQLNKALEMIQEKHQPPMVRGRRLKFFYASQVAVRPPTVVIMVNRPDDVHFSYRRFILNELRKVMNLKHSPLKLILKERSGRREKKK